MEKNKFKPPGLLLLFMIIILMSSCDRPECKNTNPVFDNFQPDSHEYKDELAKQMETIGKENLTYWIHRMGRKDGQDFVELYVQGEGLCAKLFARNNTSRLRGRKQSDYSGGFGYRGARLTGVEITTELDSSGANFILEKIDQIID